jgi:hypothetical protein
VAGPHVDDGVTAADPHRRAVDEAEVAAVGGDLHLRERVLDEALGAEAVGHELHRDDPVAGLVEHPGDLEGAVVRHDRAGRLELNLEAE